MPTVTINSQQYPVYGDVAAANVYLDGSLTAEAWRDADPDTKARALVSATRWIDSLPWLGDKTDPDQPLAWPRTGIEGVDSATVPTEIVNASFELAAGLADDPDFRTSYSAVATKRLKAGSVEIENFRGTTVQVTTPFPANIMAMIGQWLAGSAGNGGFGGAISYGTCRETTLDRPYDFRDGL